MHNQLWDGVCRHTCACFPTVRDRAATTNTINGAFFV